MREALARLASAGLAAALAAILALLVCLGRARNLGAPVLAVLALLAAGLLAVTWQRWPKDLARTGFLLVHAGALLVLAGLLGPRPLLAAGGAGLALGLPWMFYLKPRLKPKKPGPAAPAWQRFALQGTRILLLALGALLGWKALRGAPAPPWALPWALLLVAALHLHHAKAWKGARAQAAALGAWALGLGLLARGAWLR